MARLRSSPARAFETCLFVRRSYYPERPSASEQRAARGLVQALLELYPCTDCRADFQTEVARAPLDAGGGALGSRAALQLWLCRQHNLVNVKLGKPEFTCAPEASSIPSLWIHPVVRALTVAPHQALDQRWRTGAPHCALECVASPSIATRLSRSMVHADSTPLIALELPGTRLSNTEFPRAAIRRRHPAGPMGDHSSCGAADPHSLARAHFRISKNGGFASTGP